jgi:hydroxypyruvate reductase
MPLRDTSRQIFRATLDRLQIPTVMQRQIRYDGNRLHVGGTMYAMDDFRNIKIVSAGKAAVPMAVSLMDILAPHISLEQTLDGIVVGAALAERRGLRSFLGGHPIPTEQSLLAAAAVLECLSDSDSETLVFFLISGGCSTMLEQPLDSAMTLADTAAFHDVLVHSGLRIQEMNTLRKHFSAVKGGRLAVAAANATKCTLLVSDVPEGALDVIGSGPALPDPSTVADCRAILREHRHVLPFSDRLLDFFTCALPETPKADHPAFLHASVSALLSSENLSVEAVRLAQQEGFHVVVDNTCDDWNYEAAAEYLLQRIAALRRTHKKVCLISAGEISVKVEHGQGIGGRNQHFVLECAARIAESGQQITVLSAGSDGIDGNSPAAGGIADETTVARANNLGLSLSSALKRFDSHTLLEALGDTLVIGPSGNNVRDLRMLFSESQAGDGIA